MNTEFQVSSSKNLTSFDPDEDGFVFTEEEALKLHQNTNML
jgi:hypothetical protein